MRHHHPPAGQLTDLDARNDALAIARDDAALVRQARIEPEAFAALYERYRQVVYVYCFRRLASPDRADDATSTVFMKAFSGLSGFRLDDERRGLTFRSWLFSIAHNTVVDAWRRERQHLSLDGQSGVANLLADGQISPEDAALGAEEARAVIALLTQLPERQRAAIELRLAGLTTPEIARTMGVTVPAAKSLQVRGYRLLRDLLRANPDAISREIPA